MTYVCTVNCPLSKTGGTAAAAFSASDVSVATAVPLSGEPLCRRQIDSGNTSPDRTEQADRRRLTLGIGNDRMVVVCDDPTIFCCERRV